jgi:hypothetical protein
VAAIFQWLWMKVPGGFLWNGTNFPMALRYLDVFDAQAHALNCL